MSDLHLLIIDLGSLHGIYSDNYMLGDIKNSPIKFPLEKNNLKIYVGPNIFEITIQKIKECVICMSAPRTYKTIKCGHYICCEDCVAFLDDICIICREKTEYEFINIQPNNTFID